MSVQQTPPVTAAECTHCNWIRSHSCPDHLYACPISPQTRRERACAAHGRLAHSHRACSLSSGARQSGSEERKEILSRGVQALQRRYRSKGVHSSEQLRIPQQPRAREPPPRQLGPRCKGQRPSNPPPSPKCQSKASHT